MSSGRSYVLLERKDATRGDSIELEGCRERPCNQLDPRLGLSVRCVEPGTMSLELAGMIVLTIIGVIFYVTVWVVVWRRRRRDEPPRR
jgi:hypothetical protein